MSKDIQHIYRIFTLSPVNSARFVYHGTHEASPEEHGQQGETAPEGQSSDLNFDQHENELKKRHKYENETAEKLAGKIANIMGGDEKTKNSILINLRNNEKDIDNKLRAMNAQTDPAKKPGLFSVKKVDNGWHIFFYDIGDKDVVESIILDNGFRITPTPKAPAPTPENKEKPEQQDTKVKIDKEKIAKEQERLQEAKEREEKRKPHWNEITGLVTLTGWKETREITLTTLLSEKDGIEQGDIAFVTSPEGHRVTATFNGKDWVDTVYKQHVPIFNKSIVKLSGSRRKVEERPQTLPNLKAGESIYKWGAERLTPAQVEKAIEGELDWTNIARFILEQEQYKAIKDRGYTYQEYGKILADHSTDTGYYWIIMPPPSLRKRQEEAAQKAWEEGGKEGGDAKNRETMPNHERYAHNWRTYEKHAKKLFSEETKYVFRSPLLRARVKDPERWTELWNNYWEEHIDQDAIMRAFRNNPPYNKTKFANEGEVREGLRAALYSKWNKVRMSFDDFLEVFNQGGEIYTNIDGTPGSLADMREEWDILNVSLPKKLARALPNKQGNLQIPGLTEKEQKVWTQLWQKTIQSGKGANLHEETIKSALPARIRELTDIYVGGAAIFEAIFDKPIKPMQEKLRYFRTTPVLPPTQEEASLVAKYQKNIFGGENVETHDSMDDTIDDEKKFYTMWEKKEGNIGLVQKVLETCYPFNRIPIGAHKVNMYKALSEGQNGMDMKDILDHMNFGGRLYKNRQGKAGTFDDFQKEVKNNPELGELVIASAKLLDAVGKLRPNGTLGGTLGEGDFERDPNKKPAAFLDQIFPPTDTGSVNGMPQNYSDLSGSKGIKVAGGLFEYDFDKDELPVNNIDMFTSNATANSILRGIEGGIDNPKLQARLNTLLRLGIATMIADGYRSTKNATALNALGIGPKELKGNDQTLVSRTAARFEINFKDQVMVTQLQKDIIRIGFIAESIVTLGSTIKESTENVEWSDDPEIRTMQDYAINNLGIAPQDAGKIDKAAQDHIKAFLHMSIGENFKSIKEAGVTFPILQLTNKRGDQITMGSQFGMANDNGVPAPFLRLGFGGTAKISENVTAFGGLGVSSSLRAYAGASITIRVPIDPDAVWVPSLTIGAVASMDLKNPLNTNVTVGAMLMLTRDDLKEKALEFQKRLAEAAYSQVEKATNVHEKARLLRAIPGARGIAYMQIQGNAGFSDEGLVNFYEQYARNQIDMETAKTNGFWKGFGIGAGVSIGDDITLGFGFFAIAIGTELRIYQRPSLSAPQMTMAADQKINRDAQLQIYKLKLEEAAKANGYTIKYETLSEDLVGDIENGMKPVKKEQSQAQAQLSEDRTNKSLDEAFKKTQEEMRKVGIHLEKSPDSNMYRLRVNTTGNLDLYVDPLMREKMGVFVYGNEFYISASKNPNLIIKRFDDYYPRPRYGNVRQTTLIITDNDFVTREQVEKSSDFVVRSRTEDNTGVKRSPLTFQTISYDNRISQFNLRYWNPSEAQRGDYSYFDRLDVDTAEEKTHKERTEKQKRNAELGNTLRKHIGEADISGITPDKMKTLHKNAQEFMTKNYNLYRAYTTHRLTSKPQLLELEKKIHEQFPELNEDERYVLKEELFNQSMTEEKKAMKYMGAREQLIYKRQLVHQRLEWAKKVVYEPFFKEYSNAENNPENIPAELLAEAFVAPIRNAALENPELLLQATRLDVAVGTGGYEGRRDFIVSQPSQIAEHRLYVAKDYLSALQYPEPSPDRTIALILRESQNPIDFAETPQGIDKFLASPMAVKLMLLGTPEGRPAFAEIMGTEMYEKLVNCYETKPPKAINDEQTKAAIAQLKDWAKILSNAQKGEKNTGAPILVNGTEYQTLKAGNTILGIRTRTLKSGVYERCFNGAYGYDDEIIAISEETRYEQVGNMRVYSAAVANTLQSSFKATQTNAAAGVTFEVAPTPPPAPPVVVPQEGAAGPGGSTHGDTGIGRAAPQVAPGTAGQQGPEASGGEV